MREIQLTDEQCASLSKTIRAEKAFQENIQYDFLGNQHWYSCTKGLFSVSGGNKEIAEREARHYFIQYYEDGEYEPLSY